MARTTLTPTDLNADADGAVVFSGTAGTADGHQFVITGNEIVVVTKSSSSGDVTFPAAADVDGENVDDRVISCTSVGSYYIIGDLETKWFRQSDGYCYINFEAGEESEFSVMVIRHRQAT